MTAAAERPALTARHYQIPAAVARDLAFALGPRLMRRLGLEPEDLEGMAAAALLAAADAWDPERSPGGADHLGSFLVQQTRWRVNHQLKYLQASKRLPPGRSVVSLDRAARPQGDGDDPAFLARADEDRGLRRLETLEVAEECLRRLRPLARACARLVWMRGVPVADVARRLGCSVTAVNDRLRAARSALRRSGLLAGARAASNPHGDADPLRRWRAEDPARARRQLLAACRRSARTSRETAAANRLLGRVIANEYYLHDPGARTLVGPYPTQADALTALGITDAPTRGRSLVWEPAALGWPGLRPSEAKILDALAAGALLTIPEAAEAAGVTRHTADLAMPRLVRAGLAEPAGKRPPSGPGGPRTQFRATALALSSRGPVSPARPVPGRDARRLQAEGCEVRPPSPRR